MRTDRQREKYFLELKHQLNTSTKPKVKKRTRTKEHGGQAFRTRVPQRGNRTRWASYNKKNSGERTDGNRIHHQ